MSWVERCGLSSKDWAIVTGASSGLGLEYVNQLAAAGLRLVLVARRRERLEATRARLEQNGVESLIVVEDLATEGAAERIAAAVGSRPVGMIVNNAGFGLHDYFHQADASRVMAMLAVHNTVPMALVHTYLESMIDRNRGAIVNVSSLASLTPSERNVTYTASKSFLNGFSEALAQEMARLAPKVRVQSLCPGFTRTEFLEVPEYDDFDSRTIPSSLWMSSEAVVKISLSQLGRRSLVVPGFKNRILARLWRVAAFRSFLTQ